MRIRNPGCRVGLYHRYPRASASKFWCCRVGLYHRYPPAASVSKLWWCRFVARYPAPEPGSDQDGNTARHHPATGSRGQGVPVPGNNIFPIVLLQKYLPYCNHQCSGSMTLWCGSGSGSADPCLWLMDQYSDPVPAIFVIDLQDANKNNFFLNFICLLIFESTFIIFQR